MWNKNTIKRIQVAYPYYFVGSVKNFFLEFIDDVHFVESCQRFNILSFLPSLINHKEVDCK